MSNLDNIEVLQNLSDNIITFDTKEQFMRYYDSNKDTIDNMATRGLNTKFKINGFKIGRKNNKLILIPLKEINENKIEDNSTEFENLNMKIDILIDRINKLELFIKQTFSNQSRQSLSNNPNNQLSSSYTSGVADILRGTVRNSYQ